MAEKKSNKSNAKVWVIMSFIMFILLVVLGIKLLEANGHVDASLTVQENLDGIKAWWNALGFVVKVNGWFS